MTTDSPARVWRWLVALVAVGAQNTKLIAKLIAAAAQDIYQNEYTAEKIKKSIDSIFFRGGLLLTVWLPFAVLWWGFSVGLVFLFDCSFVSNPPPPGLFDLLRDSRGHLWAFVEWCAGGWLMKESEIDFKKLTLYVTNSIMLLLALRFLWSLFFNSLRHIFENTFHSTHFREFVYGEYKTNYFKHKSDQEKFLLKFKGKFLLMAALKFDKQNDRPTLILGPDACDRPVGDFDSQGWWWRLFAAIAVLVAVGDSYSQGWWWRLFAAIAVLVAIVGFHSQGWRWRRWAFWCWRIRCSTVKYPMRIGYAIVKFDLRKMSVEPSTYRKELDSAYTVGYAYVSWYRSKIRHCFGWKPAPIEYLHGQLGNLPKKNEPLSDDEFITWVNEQIYDASSNHCPQKTVIRPGLGVQAITIFNDHADNMTSNMPNWKVILQKRAANVASSPGHFQFIPSGGFESHQTYYEGRKFDTVLRNTLERECSLERGLLREFAEEVLGVPEFATNEKLDPDDVYRDPSIVALRRLMADTRKKQTEPTDHPILSVCTRANYGSENTNPWAALVPLGTALSLVGFKPEISYALIIDSKEFFIERKLQRAENEAKGILTWPLTELDHLVNGEQTFVDASYVLLKLLIDEEQTLNCLLKQQLCPKGATYIISSLNKHFTDGVKDVSASPVTDTTQSAPLVGTQ